MIKAMSRQEKELLIGIITEAATKATENSPGIGSIPASERLYQFKITLQEVKPLIWRRIQVEDCGTGGRWSEYGRGHIVTTEAPSPSRDKPIMKG